MILTYLCITDYVNCKIQSYLCSQIYQFDQEVTENVVISF
jgi:hypothetical protein